MNPAQASAQCGGCIAGQRKKGTGEVAWGHWLHCAEDWTKEYAMYLMSAANNTATPTAHQYAQELHELWSAAEAYVMKLHQAASVPTDDTPVYLWLNDFLNCTNIALNPSLRTEYLRKPYESLIQLIKYKILHAPQHRSAWNSMLTSFDARLRCIH